ncbi:uncharacterized protein LOC110115836 [Dendrobium catenatum]|uniref:DUF4378 domain-containing protein n=1 Tax=Dendrobium catenatum TaxID=906689 RepID=A0A2I0X5H3_9ASPA|nr:uncharacterized protein LOC110115836 [Dendrobium catenatum]PKU83137.1 hypothetical protein MA16_Dca007795 [Dendrobium catenatum]
MDDKGNNIMNRGIGTTWMFSFIGKKLSKRKKHKGKISPSSSRMLRTISIHHLECTDFVPESEVGQTASDSKSSKDDLNSDSFAMSEHESQVLQEPHGSSKGKPGEACRGIDVADDLPGSHDKLDKIQNHLLHERVVLKEKLAEARDDLLKLKDVNPQGISNEFANQSKLFLDTLELFNANREALLDGPEDSNYISPDYTERLQAPTKARMLTKSVSFPGLEFSGRTARIFLPSYNRMKSDSFVTQGTKSESVSSCINVVEVGFDSDVLPSSHELRKRREAGTVLNRLRNLKQKIKDVITENRKEKSRTVRDGILHKVPFGHKLLEDMKDKKLNLWDDSASERCDRVGEGRNFNNASHGSYSKFERKSFQRSCSLAESLDRYSHLLETLSLNEKGGEVTENSKSNQKDNGLLQGMLPKSLGRMFSSPVLRSYSFSKAVQSDFSPDSSKVLAAEPIGSKMDKVVSSKSTLEDNGLQQDKLSKNSGRMLSYSFSNDEQSERYLESTQILSPESLGIVMEKNLDKPTTDAIISPILEKNDYEHEMVVDPDSLSCAEEAIRPDKFVTPTVESITEMIDSQVNPVSVDDSEHIEPSLFTEVVEEEADLVNRREVQIEAESDIKSPSFISSLDLNMVDDSSSSAKYLPGEGSESPPIPNDSDAQHLLSDTKNKIDCNEQNLTENFNFGCDDEQKSSSFFVHVDHKYDTLFQLVRNILCKSGFGVLLSSYEFGIEKDTPFEQKLLYDLINEVLQEIYENCTVPNPWLLHFHSKIRSMPVGNYLLKDVWTEICWHLCTPQGFYATLDDLMAYDFAKNGGWMNLYRDAECVALQLEYLILDDLLEEAVVASDGFDFLIY